MSVIAYDGLRIAADRRGVGGDICRTMCKLFPTGEYILGIVGTEESGLLLVDWFTNGCHLGEWPEKAQDDEDNRALLIVASRQGVSFYCQFPRLTPIHDPFWAWGCGRDLAIGAMAMGADAVRAVEITSKFNIYCGHGVDVYTLADLPKVQTAEDRVRAKAKRKQKTK